MFLSYLGDWRSPISDLQSPISGLQSPISDLRSPISNHRSPISQDPEESLRSRISKTMPRILFPFSWKQETGNRNA